MDEHVQFSDKEFSLICEAAASFHTIRDMDEMLLDVLDKIKTIFAIEGASIALHDPEAREFYFIRTVEDPETPSRLARTMPHFPDHQGIAGWVMANGQSAIINDVAEDARFHGDIGRPQDFHTRSMICVPLRTRKGFLGVLYALNKLRGDFTERERKTLEILSGTIAVSLENARLYGEMQDHVDTLQREKRQLESQLRASASNRTIIGSSPVMRRMFDLIDKVTSSSATVLIQGETGTGKELIAKVIHYNGPLKDRPFVAENCGALPENLLESELFGHVKGAFTGAITNKKGLFEIADGGTIFLDEIGEMPLAMQVKLLRVLQEGQFRPVGGNRTLEVNVRVIASTNRDLAAEIRNGAFREDLFFRINVFQIIAPPLRDRLDDIPQLATHFLRKLATKADRPTPRISPSVIDLLMRFDWPGNVRELENEMHRALTMAGDDQFIREEFLSDKIRRLRSAKDLAEFAPAGGNLKDVVQQVEQRMITQALAEHGGNRSRAAQSLGLSRQGLLNKISAYRIPSQPPQTTR